MTKTGNFDAFFREKYLTKNIPLAQYLKISLDAIIHEAPLETDHTTYQILEELQNCSEEDRLIALRTLRELLAALKEKDQINKPHF